MQLNVWSEWPLFGFEINNNKKSPTNKNYLNVNALSWSFRISQFFDDLQANSLIQIVSFFITNIFALLSQEKLKTNIFILNCKLHSHALNGTSNLSLR